MGVTVTTTESVEGETINEYLGIASGEAVMGANVVRDVLSGIRDVVGGRSGAYEKEIQKGREEAIKDLKAESEDLGADAVVGVSFDYEEMGEGMLWVNATGTAVEFS